MTRFTKMQAYGNDYVYIDAINQKINNVHELAKYISNRHFGVGSDGLVLICKSDVADFRMRMFNPDGTEGEMCGNALRSLSKYVYDHKLTDKEELTIETLGGIQHVKLTVENGKAVNIEANIGKPVLDTTIIPVNTKLPEFIEQEVKILDKTFKITAVSWGNPHCVMFIDDVDNFDVEKYGKAIEYKTDIFPNKTNVTFAQVIDRNNIKMREWERGTGETIGCGTGCCTATVAAVLTGRCDRKVSVHLLGGILETNWDEKTGKMFMKGPSHTVFESEIDVDDIIKKYRITNLRKLVENVDYELIKGSLDVDISDNNEYMAFAEVNTTGTTVQSNVKIVSIKMAKETPSESIIYTNQSTSNKLIVNIEYQGNDKVVCMYDDEITVMQNDNNNSIVSLNEDNKNINFANINLDNYIYRTVEETEGLFLRTRNRIYKYKRLASKKILFISRSTKSSYW